MEQLALAALIGTGIGLWLPPLISLPMLSAIALTAAGFRVPRAGQLSLCLLTACCWAILHAGLYRHSLPGKELYQADVPVSGCIVNFPRVDARSAAFLFQTTGATAPSRLLYLRSFDRELSVAAGQCFDFMVRLKPPHGQVNPGQFDRQKWFMAQRVQATGYIRPSNFNKPRDDLHAPNPALYLRICVYNRLQRALAERPAKGLLQGLITGVRITVRPEQWRVLRATGTAHLMAISGLHVGLVAGGLWGLVLLVTNRLTVAGRHRWLASLAAGGAAFGYAILAGWSVPTSRAALMFVVLLVVTGRNRLPRATMILAGTMLATLIADPFALLSAGFWMSYLAVALLVTMRPPVNDRCAASSRLARCRVALKIAVRAQLRLSLGLMLPNLLLFDAWPLLSLLVNLLAIPVFSAVLLPLALIGTMLLFIVPSLGAPLLQLTATLLEWAMALLTGIVDSGWALSDWPLRWPSAAYSLATGAGLWLLPRALRPWPLVLLLSVVVLLLMQPHRPALQIDVLDVGQGTAVLVRVDGRALLVDAGPAWPSGDAGESTLVPFFRRAGVERLDAVLVSHSDSDHRGGLASVLRALPVARVLSPDALPDSGSQRCRAGIKWQWGDAGFAILHPARRNGWTDNNASCVLRIDFRGSHVLLPGDIEADAEAVLTARQADLHSELVLAPHHGSSTSSGQGFVTATRPQYVVYTTAYWNRWGFPQPDIVQRWSHAGACGLNTAETGQLSFVWQQGEGLILQKPRKSHWTRPWAIRPESDDYCL